MLRCSEEQSRKSHRDNGTAQPTPTERDRKYLNSDRVQLQLHQPCDNDSSSFDRRRDAKILTPPPPPASYVAIFFMHLRLYRVRLSLAILVSTVALYTFLGSALSGLAVPRVDFRVGHREQQGPVCSLAEIVAFSAGRIQILSTVVWNVGHNQ